MRKLLILVPLIAAAAFAGNCHRMSDDELSSTQEGWRKMNPHHPILVWSGVLCDEDIFYNFTYDRSGAGCSSWVGNRLTRIIENGTKSLRTEYTTDEFGMPEKTTTIERNRKTCEELYAEFKRKTR